MMTTLGMQSHKRQRLYSMPIFINKNRACYSCIVRVSKSFFYEHALDENSYTETYKSKMLVHGLRPICISKTKQAHACMVILPQGM